MVKNKKQRSKEKQRASSRSSAGADDDSASDNTSFTMAWAAIQADHFYLSHPVYLTSSAHAFTERLASSAYASAAIRCSRNRHSFFRIVWFFTMYLWSFWIACVSWNRPVSGKYKLKNILKCISLGSSQDGRQILYRLCILSWAQPFNRKSSKHLMATAAADSFAAQHV